MPWKLLAFIAIMAVVLVFVGFNLDNRCDISVVFFVFRSVPVVITILAAYLLGLLSAFFLAIGRKGAGKTAERTAGRTTGRTTGRTVASIGDLSARASSAAYEDEPAPLSAAPSPTKKRPKP